MQTWPENRKTAWRLLVLYGFNLAGMLVWPAHWLILSGQGLSFLSLLQPLYYVLFLAALPIAALVHAVFRTSHKAIAALYVAIAGFSLLPALFIAAISLPTFAKLTMISALNFSTLCLITAIYLAKFEYRKAKALRLLFSIAFLLPVWSFLSVPMLRAYALCPSRSQGRRQALLRCLPQHLECQNILWNQKFLGPERHFSGGKRNPRRLRKLSILFSRIAIYTRG